MKAKQRSDSCSKLRQPTSAPASHDSPHLSVNLPKHISSSKMRESNIRTPLVHGNQEVRETVKPVEEFEYVDDDYDGDIEHKDYELPLEGNKRSKEKGKRKGRPKKKVEEEKPETDQESAHFELELDDSGLQSFISEMSMDEWLHDDRSQSQTSFGSLLGEMNNHRPEISRGSLLGEIPSDDELLEEFPDAGAKITERKTSELARRKEESVDAKKRREQARHNYDYDMMKAHELKRSNSHLGISSATPRPVKDVARSTRPSDPEDDQAILSDLAQSNGSASWQNPLKKASPEVVTIYVSSSEWKSRQRLRSEWSEFVKGKRHTRPSPRLTEDIMLNEHARSLSRNSSPRQSPNDHNWQSRVDIDRIALTRPSRRASMGGEELGMKSRARDEELGMKSRARSSRRFSGDGMIQPPDLGLDPSEIRQRRKILQRTMSMRMSTRNIDGR